MSMKILLEPHRDSKDWPNFNLIRKWKIEPKIYDPEKYLYKRWFELDETETGKNGGVSFLFGTLYTAEFTSKKEAETFAVIDKLIN